jgi:hypothetical protein
MRIWIALGAVLVFVFGAYTTVLGAWFGAPLMMLSAIIPLALRPSGHPRRTR